MYLDDSKNAHLKALEGAGERLYLYKADLLDYDSVASAVAGCEGVFHVASPVPSGRSSNPEVKFSTTYIFLIAVVLWSFEEQAGIAG